MSRFNPFDEDYLTEILQAAAVGWACMHHPQADEIEYNINVSHRWPTRE
ncbi:MAG: hypothetical protein ACREDR_14970 [Blastocatellia bacterium]